jgi:hypothetical protein
MPVIHRKTILAQPALFSLLCVTATLSQAQSGADRSLVFYLPVKFALGTL